MNPTDFQHKTIEPPGKQELFILRFLIMAGLVSLCQFLYWYFDDEHIGHTLLFWLLTFAFGYKILHLLYEWYYFASIKVPANGEIKRTWKVDMLTTWMPGEPKEMVVETLRAMVAVRYPHTTYLCDEGNDPGLKQICEKLGVVHVYRGTDKTGAKAGNINHALCKVATGEICVILDPDHIPVPEFLDQVLPHFEDEKVGFVQCIQAYYNQQESLIAKGAAEQTYLFYGPMMMGMHRQGTVQAIGANCTFRREALDSIGGHAQGLCEDMHTAMQLHAKKWTSVYVPELLTKGKAPGSLSHYYGQQLKWARGSFELLFEVFPKLAGKFTWRQRLHYFLTPLYFFYGVVGLIDIGIPIVSLFTLHVPLYIKFDEFVLRAVPLILTLTLIRHYSQRYVLEPHEMGFHTMGGILRVGTWWVYLTAFIYAVFRVKVPYLPTPKENQMHNDWMVSLPNLAVIIVSIFAIVYGLSKDWTPFSLLMAGFAGVNILLLGTITMASQRRLLMQLFGRLQDGILKVLRSYWRVFRERFIFRPMQHNGVAVLLSMTVLGVSTVPAFYPHSFQNVVEEIVWPIEKRTAWFLTPAAEGSAPMLAAAGAPSLEGRSGRETRHLQNYYLPNNGKDLSGEWKTILNHSKSQEAIPFIRWSLPCEVPGETIEILGDIAARYREPVILLTERNEESDPQEWGLVQSQLIRKFRSSGAANVFMASTLPPDGKMLAGANACFEITVLKPGQVQNFIKNNSPQVVLLESAGHPGTALINLLAEAGHSVAGWVNQEKPSSHRPAFYDEMELGPQGITYPHSGKFSPWFVDGTPFYVKGIFYNPEHEWQDGNWPLTRRQLMHDFSLIKSMGANTVTWYSKPAYDFNVMEMAGENNLKILFGFRLDPSLNYASDAEDLAALKAEILRKVRKWKDRNEVIAWLPGNGTWNNLELYFQPPYLGQVRLAYTRFLNEIATEIKQLDPSRPVIVATDAGPGLAGAVRELQHAPAIDIIGVNSHTAPQFDSLDSLLAQWAPGRPYLLTGFGPGMAWDTLYAGLNAGDRLPEASSFAKASAYAGVWEKLTTNANNLGGVAFCWRDRFEGTATMSGITDFKGRLKPAFFALKESWTGEPQSFTLSDLILTFETYHYHGENTLIFKALTKNNTSSPLHYDWYICRDEFVERIDELSIRHNWWGSLIFWWVSNFKEHFFPGMYPEKKGHEVRLRSSDTAPWQRIYLHISDDNGHVVTASFPIYPDRIIQRLKWPVSK